MSKSQRQHLLAQILEEQAVSSQAKLVELLKAEGIDVTQATLSRDLEELGAVKVRVPVGDSVQGRTENACAGGAPQRLLDVVCAELDFRAADRLVADSPRDDGECGLVGRDVREVCR